MGTVLVGAGALAGGLSAPRSAGAASGFRTPGPARPSPVAAGLPRDSVPLSIVQAATAGDAGTATFTVTAAQAFPDAQADFRIGIDTDADAVADAWVVVDFDAATGAMRAGIGPAGSAHLAAAHVGRADDRTIEVSFPRSLMGGARAFTWQVEALTPGTSTTTERVSDFPNPPVLSWPAPARVAGPDRIATAIAASFFGDADASAVVLARSDDYADALAGVPLAAAKDGPLLLTPPANLDPRTLAEMRRCLAPGATVYLLGGTAALSDSVEDAVRAAGYAVVRLAGADRYDTSLAVLQQGLGSVARVLLATGNDFPDALAAGAAAGARGGGVLLTDGAELPAAIASYVATSRVPVFAVGGPAAAADPLATAVEGPDRYATAAAVASALFDHPPAVGVASGLSYPDAVVGGATMAEGGGPLLLTDPRSLPPATADYLRTDPGAAGFVFGGSGAVGDGAAAQVREALQAP